MPQSVCDLCIEQSTVYGVQREQMKEGVQNIRPKMQVYLSLFKNQTSENVKQKYTFLLKNPMFNVSSYGEKRPHLGNLDECIYEK